MTKPARTRRRLFAAALFLAFHYYLIIYVNSGFVSQYVNDKGVGFLYALGAALALLGLYLIPYFLRNYGTVVTTLFLIVAECTTFAILAIFDAPGIVLPFFVIAQAIPILLLYCMDIFLEKTTNEKSTGTVRGLYLTLMNGALVLCAVLSGYIVGWSSFSYVYAAAAFFLIPMFVILLATFIDTGDAHYHTIRFKRTLHEVLKHPSIGWVLVATFILHFFYAVMVIYMPLLLSHGFGFNWTIMGAIFAFMLLPFPLLEWPLGVIADKFKAEKEILVIGFCIMAATTFLIPFLTIPSFVLWALLLFGTRIGASMAEVASETYFFKHVTEDDTDLISFFRGVIPFAYLIAPFAIDIITGYAPLSGAFSVLGVCMIAGAYAGLRMKDTR